MPSPPVVCPLGEIYRATRYPDIKDPCPVFDGTVWHLFGTGCGLPGGPQVLHSTAPAIDGPWEEHDPVRLSGVDVIRFPAAPGVIADGTCLHMYLQHDFNILDGCIEHLVSHDGGDSFVHADTAIASLAGGPEAGVYDPDPAEVLGVRYITYAAMSVVGQPDLFIARSLTDSWGGPWERLGCILSHADVELHNQVGDDDYEWGLEGPQLTELPGGRVLLIAVCFLAGRPAGHRQRLIAAVAKDPTGPYAVLGPLIEPAGGLGENGHGTAFVEGDRVHVVYQERGGEGLRWHFRRATVPVARLAATRLPDA